MAAKQLRLPVVAASSRQDPTANMDPNSSPGMVSLSKRALLQGVAAGILIQPFLAELALAAPKKVVVIGATGATGIKVVKELQAIGGLQVVAGVRNLDKAKKLGLEGLGVELVKLDVTSDVGAMAQAIGDADVVVCATGFVPGNPFKMAEAAHQVDNVGTVNLVDAAVKAGVKKFVLVSSILTNGRGWGQENSAGFRITNAFGGVLDEKLVAEKHLRSSGMDYTIIRPGGLKNEVSGKLAFSPEDTLASGEVSRELVAKVMAQAAVLGSSSNKVVEIVETGTCAPGTCPDNLAAAPESPEEWTF